MEINIDNYIDYRAEYSAVIKKARVSGDSLVGLCPFHDDTSSSFSADLKTGKWHCFAEDIGGNFISFWARFNNTDNKTAYKQIFEKYNVLNVPNEPKKPEQQNYTLNQYAYEKHLDADWLKERFRIEEAKTKDGRVYIKIPYYNANGDFMTFRHRFFGKEFKWAYGSKGKICLYNLQALESIKKAGYVLLVEGESDTQTLTYLGLPALGVPGASMFKPDWARELNGLRLYIHKEPDQGGETFLIKLREGLKKGGFEGEVFEFGCSRFNVKDPSELYLDKGKDEAAKLIRKALSEAERVEIKEEMPTSIPDQPIGLRQPEGWIFSEKGISFMGKEGQITLVCRVPIILTKRLHSLETGEEKVEIAFYRDNRWHTVVAPRSTIFTARSITALSDRGCTVTSENAKLLVRYLSALEAENIDIIPLVSSVGTFGWHGKKFVPWCADGIELDIDPTQSGIAAAYTQSGEYGKWLDIMRPHRERDKFRFIMAASFAAPLLNIIKQRTFFVYNWGGSKGGKTAALYAALSVWGDPHTIKVSFNATQVGLERTAAFCCDLPLGIDERQLAGNTSQAQNGLEKIVYMVSSGQGKVRGNKGGGLQHTHRWRTVAIATGEEPIAADTTQTGVSTRTIEIYGAPFDKEAEASEIYALTAQNHGWAGMFFIEKLINADKEQICALYEKMLETVKKAADGKSGSHVAGIAAVALADALAEHWLFGGGTGTDIPADIWKRAEKMAANIMGQQMTAAETDVNENARQYIVDWVMSNQACFGTKVYGQCYGFLDNDKNKVYIFPSVLTETLKKGGFSPRKTLKDLADKGVITTANNGKNTVYSVMKFFVDRSCRFVEFDLGNGAEYIDPLYYDAESVGDDEELPF